MQVRAKPQDSREQRVRIPWVDFRRGCRGCCHRALVPLAAKKQQQQQQQQA
jgi:hypothetical protein